MLAGPGPVLAYKDMFSGAVVDAAALLVTPFPD